MTKIRRINVSQIEGDDADNTSTDEIRPNGETAFYIDNNDKLTLMMFNGVRTHRKSKVLAPGVLWGSNTDSGDGLSLDTIKLIPDAEIFANGSDQYVIVDPTAPNHIHLRAGGTIDNSSADLFLGGEKNYVKVSDGGDTVVIATTQPGDPETVRTWVFDNAGNITLPTGGDILNSNGNSVLGGSTNAETLDITDTNGLTTTYYPTFVENRTTGQYVRSDVNFTYRTDTNTLNVGAMQFGNQRIRVVSAPVSSVGATGDLVGDVAFSSEYIYYCTENFGGITYSVLNAFAEGTSANGVDNGYLVPNTYQLPEVGWKVYYNGEVRTINQVNSSGIPDFYVIFVDSSLVIPGQATFSWGPTPTTNIWKRVAWSGDTW